MVFFPLESKTQIRISLILKGLKDNGKFCYKIKHLSLTLFQSNVHKKALGEKIIYRNSKNGYF